MSYPLQAGAASIEWTPAHSFHLAGYPHVERHSDGVADPLLATAICLRNGESTFALVSLDILFITHAVTGRIRERLAEALGLPPDHVLVAATHTHSGPAVVEPFAIPSRPPQTMVEPAILRRCEDAAVQAVCEAHANLVDAEATFVVADATGVGTNRRDPDGPHNPEAPLLVFRQVDGRQPIAALAICSMHPTVLHEGSRQISGDFPAYARRYLQTHQLGEETPILYLTGAAGNQSPRHVTLANTLDEARRLGELLGQRWSDALNAQPLEWHATLPITCQRTELRLPSRNLPDREAARREVDQALEHFESLRRNGAPPAQVRTAEVDWFGAEHKALAVEAEANGAWAQAIAERTPTELQILYLGTWTFVAWPGEVYVEFALQIRAQHPDAHVITYANGEHRGYLVTAEAMARGGYEASYGLFSSPDSGDKLVRATLAQLSCSSNANPLPSQSPTAEAAT